MTALTLLDLSAAFDTIYHQILLNRLTEWFGLVGDALQWVVSYLQHCFQSVQISSIMSNPMELIFRVSQGSVLGPLLFIMYTRPLSSLQARISNIAYTQITQKYTIPSTYPVLIILYTIFKTSFSQSRTGLIQKQV